jgi:hypothetical protein
LVSIKQQQQAKVMSTGSVVLLLEVVKDFPPKDALQWKAAAQAVVTLSTSKF